jgi:dTDP-4-dehydrorhamnose reductase
MKRLLVTGASGLLGWSVCAAARQQWLVVGVVNGHAVALPGVSQLLYDLTRLDALPGLFRRVAPDAVIHCAAAAQPDYCQEHPDETRPINVEAPARIADLCALTAIPYAFVSTDLVFDGTRPPYKEEDPVSPIGVYGKQKADAERAVRARHPNALLCRLSPMFGDPGPASASFIQPWIAALRSGQELTLFVDEFRTPVSVRAAAAGLLVALGADDRVLHLGGRERISRYDLGLLLAELLGADAGLIRGGRQRDRVVGAPRPPDVSLDSSRAHALGFDPPPLREELRALLRDLGLVA